MVLGPWRPQGYPLALEGPAIQKNVIIIKEIARILITNDYKKDPCWALWCSFIWKIFGLTRPNSWGTWTLKLWGVKRIFIVTMCPHGGAWGRLVGNVCGPPALIILGVGPRLYWALGLGGPAQLTPRGNNILAARGYNLPKKMLDLEHLLALPRGYP